MEEQTQNGEGKRPSKIASIAKLIASAAALVTALVTALIALSESRQKAPEATSKAAHEELVKKLEALNSDFTTFEKRMRRHYARMDREMRLGMANAKAEANSVRALFTGYALAARQNRAPTVKTVEAIKKVVKEAQKEHVVQPPVRRPVAATQSARPPRTFKKPRSWDSLKNGGK